MNCLIGALAVVSMPASYVTLGDGYVYVGDGETVTKLSP